MGGGEGVRDVEGVELDVPLPAIHWRTCGGKKNNLIDLG